MRCSMYLVMLCSVSILHFPSITRLGHNEVTVTSSCVEITERTVTREATMTSLFVISPLEGLTSADWPRG